MFLVNFLNRNKTDSLFPLFEMIYISETVSLLAAIALGIALILPICRMRYHINIRLRVLFSLFHGIMYPISRIIVIIHQYFGPIDNVEWMHIIVCGQIKQEFLGYFTTLIAILAIDRLIATKYWAWYERGGCGTLIFFVAQEMILTIVGNTVGAALIFEYITDVDSTMYFAIVIPVGTTIFIIIYQYNRREMVKMKKGAVIHRYSVAKTFQFKENIRMLELFTKIARPLIIVSVVPFLFYPIYALIPPGIGYDNLRYFSVAMYDLMLSIACLVVIGALPAYEPSLRVYCCKKSHKNESVVPILNNENLTDAYFDMLMNDLK